MTSLFGRHSKILSPPRPSQPPPPPPLHPLDLNIQGQFTDALVANFCSLGIKAARISLYWDLAGLDPKHLSDVGDQISVLKVRGILPLVNVLAQARETEGLPASQVYSAFAQFIADCATRWPGCAWQLWNEADTPSHTQLFANKLTSDAASQTAFGTLYAEQLEIAYPIIKTADPTCLIVTTGAQMNPIAFFRGVWNVHIYADVVAFHSYGEPIESCQESLDGIQMFWTGPVWITETGLETLDDARQADAIQRIATRTHGFDRIFIFVHANADLPGYSVCHPDTLEPRPAGLLIKQSNR